MVHQLTGKIFVLTRQVHQAMSAVTENNIHFFQGFLLEYTTSSNPERGSGSIVNYLPLFSHFSEKLLKGEAK